MELLQTGIVLKDHRKRRPESLWCKLATLPGSRAVGLLPGVNFPCPTGPPRSALGTISPVNGPRLQSISTHPRIGRSGSITELNRGRVGPRPLDASQLASADELEFAKFRKTFPYTAAFSSCSSPRRRASRAVPGLGPLLPL